MTKTKIIFKARPLEKLFLERLWKVKTENRFNEDTVIPLSKVKEGICRNFSINKQQLKDFLDYFEYAGFIEISKHGIKLKFNLENEV